MTDLQLLRNRLVATARSCMRNQASLGQVYGSMQEAYWQMQSPLIYQEPSSRVCAIVIFYSPFKPISLFNTRQIYVDKYFLSYDS